jgi:uncharacterized protein (DUF58 family)
MLSSLQQQARRIEIASMRLVNEQLAGQYQSLFKGRGVIFSDVRPYYPGDDVRTIDWNVSARMNAPHVKQFVEERDRTVNIVIDVSASGWWGSAGISKRQVGAELAALVAFAAIRNHDRVGLCLVTDRVELYVPAQKGRRHVMRLVTEMLSFVPTNRGSHLALGIETLCKLSPRRSLMFVASDFLDNQAIGKAPRWESALRIAAQKHEVIAATVTDATEQALPNIGMLTVEDLETGAVEVIDTRGGRDVYAQRARAWFMRRDGALRRAGVDVVNIATDGDYLGTLLRYFRDRAAARRRSR